MNFRFLLFSYSLFVRLQIDTPKANRYNARLANDMLSIDLELVPEEGVSLEREVTAPQLGRTSDEFRLSEPVELDGRLVPLENEVFSLRGGLRASLEIDCVRCLEPVSVAVQESLELMYIPQGGDGAAVRGGATHQDEDRQLEDDEMAVSYYQERELDLGQLIWEQLHLALPMKIVCRNDCRGLCAQCGANRNSEPCSCAESNVDPRLAQLKSLLESAES